MALQKSRLMIASFSFFVPIFIIWTFVRYEFALYWLPESFRNAQFTSIIINYVSPTLFIIGWIYFMISTATYLADAMHLMFEETNFISTHYILFYGVNTLVFLIIFLIPLLTPFIVIMAFASMIWKALTSRVDYEDLDASAQRFVKIMSVVGSIPIILISILIIPESLQYSLDNWNKYYTYISEDFFFVMKSLGVAISIGGATLMYKKAAYEAQTGTTKGDFKDESYYLMEVFIFILMVALYYIRAPIVDLLFMLGPIFAIITFLLNLLKGRKDNEHNTFGNPLGIFLWLIFMISTVLYRSIPWVRLAIIIVSTVVFFMYYIAFLNHPRLTGSNN